MRNRLSVRTIPCSVDSDSSAANNAGRSASSGSKWGISHGAIQEEHDIAECSVGGFPIVCPRLNDREAGCLEAVLVAMEQVAEILHPGKERPELPPSASSDLLGQDASVEGDDPGDFRGIEFLVPIQHEVENGGAERKLQAARSDHRDSAGS